MTTAFGSFDDLSIGQTERIVTVAIDRPRRRNALAPGTLEELGRLFAALREATSPPIVVLRGAGEAAFCAGFDLAQPSVLSDQAEGRGNLLVETLRSVADYPYPVIAMIHGYCIGAGLDLAAACDIRYAAATARFAMTPAKIGTIYGGDGTLRIPRLIGPAHAAELFYSGRRIDAGRAAAIGLVNHVVEPDRLDAEVTALSSEIAANAPLSLSGTKRTFALLQNHGLTPDVRVQLDALADHVSGSRDFAEGRKAFAEKRPARFVGN